MSFCRRARRPYHRRHPFEPGLVAEPAEPGHPAPARARVQPAGRGFRLRPCLRHAGLCGAEAGSGGAHDRFAGLVARRLGPLRRPVRAHGLAQRRHLPHGRWPWWRRHRQPAFCAREQLARQRQPRQGAPPAVAHQAQVRQRHFLGRPDDPGRQRGHGVHGLQDLRFRRGPRRHLGARGRHLLGRRDRLAGRPALQRRSRAGKPAGRRADGPDLREPRRPQRQPRSGGVRARRARNLRPHGDGRLRDRGPGGRRPYLRQGPWRGRPETRGPRARGRAHGNHGPGLDQRLWIRQGR